MYQRVDTTTNFTNMTSKALTDGRTDTGGYGSKTASAGNWIQATYLRPVYVTSVHIAGGFIPSWNHETGNIHAAFYLKYSHDGRKWITVSYVKTIYIAAIFSSYSTNSSRI